MNERHAAPGVISGGRPTMGSFGRASEAGVDVWVRLQTQDEPLYAEEPEQVEAHGMRFVSIPVAGARGLTPGNARALHEALSGSELAVVHCASGNRAGGLLALRAYFEQGKSPEEALELGRAAGLTGLEADVRAVIEAHPR